MTPERKDPKETAKESAPKQTPDVPDAAAEEYVGYREVAPERAERDEAEARREADLQPGSPGGEPEPDEAESEPGAGAERETERG